MPKVTCFGEVLWDVFPKHKKIGGAPLNVALRLNSLGINTHIISRIGNDDNGHKLLQYINENGLNSNEIQIDDHYRTGIVNVSLNEKGSASYTIEFPAAWDKIELTKENIEIVRSSDALIYGSLACRDRISKETLFELLQKAKYKVFDVNLRPPHYTMELLMSLLKKSDFIKCNDEELDELCNHFKFESNAVEKQILFLSKKTNTNHICVTRGEDGAILLYNDKLFYNKGYPVKVIDTVGAGDSFLATLISELLNKKLPEEALKFACVVGALVASKEGANPKLKQSEVLGFM
ncbi:MAG: carbohydrate kinase [Bacteroidota bacterium]